MESNFLNVCQEKCRACGPRGWPRQTSDKTIVTILFGERNCRQEAAEKDEKACLGKPFLWANFQNRYLCTSIDPLSSSVSVCDLTGFLRGGWLFLVAGLVFQQWGAGSCPWVAETARTADRRAARNAAPTGTLSGWMKIFAEQWTRRWRSLTVAMALLPLAFSQKMGFATQHWHAVVLLLVACKVLVIQAILFQ